MFYRCPNCGKVENFRTDIFGNNLQGIRCVKCNHIMRKAEDVKEVKHPEILDNSSHVIGTVPSTSKNQVACPYCKSTDCKKITNTSKAVHTAIFGIFSIGRNSKNYHCNKCGSDF